MTTFPPVKAPVTALAAMVLTIAVLIPSARSGPDPTPEGALPAPTTINSTADTTHSTDVIATLTPEVTIIDADRDEHAAVNEALNRFLENGLELPNLEIRFFDDERDCGGHLGYFEPRFTPWRIRICSHLDFVITHELAHAWEHATLDDRDRTRYLSLRGLSRWNDHNTRWSERGVEDAAFIIQQNLMTDTAPKTSPAWQDRLAAFELLTGQSSPVSLE